MDILIIGAGNMGRAIATRAVAAKHSVRVIDHDDAKAEQLAADLREQNPNCDARAVGTEALASADLVVLALNYPATREFAAEHSKRLAGKVIIDIANPADFTTFDPTTAPGTSAAEELAAELPDAHVVKAFNTTFATTLTAGQVNDEQLDVFIAGDDEAAKATVTEFVRTSGLRPIEVGPLRRARALEAFQIMHMSLQTAMPNPFHSAIRLAS
jgi:predicted dinucleotide-binding enzyme